MCSTYVYLLIPEVSYLPIEMYVNTFLPDVLLLLFLCATNIVTSRYFHFWLESWLFILPCHTSAVAFLLFPSFLSDLHFPFLCTGEWCPEGGWPPSHIQLITNVPCDFWSQSTLAALMPKAVTPGRKDELGGAPGAAPTACGVGPSVPLWVCSLPSLQREISMPCEATQSPSGSQRQQVLLLSCCRRGQGKGPGEALPCHTLGKTEGTMGLQWASTNPSWNKPSWFQREVLSPSRLSVEHVPVI